MPWLERSWRTQGAQERPGSGAGCSGTDGLGVERGSTGRGLGGSGPQIGLHCP